MKLLNRFTLFAALGAIGIVANDVASVFAQTKPTQTQPPEIKEQRDVQYGAAGGEKQLFNVFGADPKQKRPALIVLHGGAWFMGSKNDVDFASREFAKYGYVTFSVGYRLLKTDKNRFPAQIDDVQRAVRYIRAHADEYGVDPNKMGGLGFSAGGHLVSLLGTTDTRDNSDKELAKYSSRLNCVVNLYGPSDLTGGADLNQVTTTLASAQEDSLGAKIVKTLLGPLPENKANYIAASPIKRIDKKTVPFLHFHGAKDTIVPLEQSEKFNEALQSAGVESRLVVFPNAGHAYMDFPTLKQTFVESLAFLNKHLK